MFLILFYFQVVPTYVNINEFIVTFYLFKHDIDSYYIAKSVHLYNIIDDYYYYYFFHNTHNIHNIIIILYNIHNNNNNYSTK